MNCRSCGAPIFFVKSVAGKLMPIDRDPLKDGNIVIVDGVGVVNGGGSPRYLSHFSTCPSAASHRKKKSPKKV